MTDARYYECRNVVMDDDRAIGCSACPEWAHKKCVHMGSLSKKDTEHVNWVCSLCLTKLRLYLREGGVTKKLENLRVSLEEKLGEVNSKVDQVQEVLTKVEKIAEQPTSSFSPSFPPIKSYASVSKKHLLIVKSTVDSQKATEKKSEISNALQGLQIVDTKFKQSNGNVILNFETQEQRDLAVQKVGELENLSVKKAKKLLPKIMICNVSTEERKENLVHTMIQRNEYLQSIDDVTKKIELVFVKDAAGETKHYILKCHPEVRGLIFKNGDRIKLEWGVYKVRARYFATICYHCCKYGHVSDNCPNKDKDPQCRKCAENHSSRDCSSDVKKCVNCLRAGKSDVNHSANDLCCPILTAEIAKIKNMTDHGY